MLSPTRPSPRLAVLIPVFNWNLAALLSELQQEILDCNLADQVQLRVFDDGSAAEFRQSLQTWWDTRLQPGWDASLLGLGHNVGRAEARNRLIAATAAPFLLFLDADVLPDRPDFLRRYLAALDRGAEVVVGGLSQKRVDKVAPDEAFYWRYFQAASCVSAEQRQARAWQFLYTSSVLVSRELVELCPLSTEFKGYGYEDVEWALRLSQRAGILHIDNAVSHCGLLAQSILWRKQREAALNAVPFLRLHPDVVDGIALLRWARRLRGLPSWLLSATAGVAGWCFLHVRCYRPAYVALQIDKLAATALALKRAPSELGA